MKKTFGKSMQRLLAYALAVGMLCGMVPVATFAEVEPTQLADPQVAQGTAGDLQGEPVEVTYTITYEDIYGNYIKEQTVKQTAGDVPTYTFTDETYTTGYTVW